VASSKDAFFVPDDKMSLAENIDCTIDESGRALSIYSAMFYLLLMTSLRPTIATSQ
jgi:hypothetical protein